MKNPSAYKHENVYLELPEEMRVPPSLVNTTTCVTNDTPITRKTECVSDVELLAPSTEIIKDLPYGILKNGNKPTFRQWKKQQTMKNMGSFKKPAIIIDESHENQNDSQLVAYYYKDKEDIVKEIMNDSEEEMEPQCIQQ